MSSRRLGSRFGLVCVLAVFVAQVSLSGCGDHSTPAADRCSRHSKPAPAGEQVNWDGVRFEVPVGWYAVSACFATGAPPPVGYLTTQPPHAQCTRLSDDAGECGPPVDHVGADDVLVVGVQGMGGTVRPNTLVAGHPARVTTSPGGGTYGESKIVRAQVQLPHHEVLEVTAYVGSSASTEPVLRMLKRGTLRPTA